MPILSPSKVRPIYLMVSRSILLLAFLHKCGPNDSVCLGTDVGFTLFLQANPHPP